jgi:hypothetical protein
MKLRILAALIAVSFAAHFESSGERLIAAESLLQSPSGNDFTADGLQGSIQSLRQKFSDDFRKVPLDAKAKFFEWALWRYHLTAYNQVIEAVELADTRGTAPTPIPGSDTATWNGALLAALSYKYAVTKDAQTLQRIVALLDGLRFNCRVSGRPGCFARCIVPEGTTIRKNESDKFGLLTNQTADGRKYYLLGNPAKGTYNQIAGGYAAMMMFAYDDLPPEIQCHARRDVADLVSHILSGDYHIVGPDGKRTPHGDLTPVIAGVGVPFNGQVAYSIIALGHFYPADDPAMKRKIAKQFQRLREDRHSYYKDPRKSPIVPQRIGNHPLVRGMNDRHHVTCAAHYGLAMEIDQDQRGNRPLNRTFMYRLGRTMYWSMRRIGNQRNALCNFMWAGMLSDPERFKMLVHKREYAATRRQVDRCIADGVEQLRRFRLDRFVYEGKYQKTETLQWADAQLPDVYHWKADPKARWQVTGGSTNRHVAAIDYLFAYWLFRYYDLDRHPSLAGHQSVLRTASR